MKNLLIALALLVFTSTGLSAASHDSSRLKYVVDQYGSQKASKRVGNDSFEKVYIDHSQLHVSNDMILVELEAGLFEATSGVFCDGNGLYVLSAFYKCPACGRANRDNICHNPKCSLYQK